MSIPVLIASELDKTTLHKLFERLDVLISFREKEDTSCLSYIDGLQEMQIELMQLLEDHDV